MRRAERRVEDDDQTVGHPLHLGGGRLRVKPDAVSWADEEYTPVNVAEPIWAAWREELAAVGGTSPLLHFEDTPRTGIELGTTHPGGLAQFITGRPTLLSSLLRDDRAFAAATAAAEEIAAKGHELATTRGIDSVHLGIGIAEWRHEGEHFRGPILLRPLALRRYGHDFELTLRGTAKLNPALAAALAEQYGIEIDPKAFVALTEQGSSFSPNPIIDRLRGLTAHLGFFAVQPRLVVSSFADAGAALAADVTAPAHPVLDALAGNPSAKWAVTESRLPADVVPSDEREPGLDTLLLDADPEQEQAVAHIAAGNSLVLTALPGTGATQTVVNAIGALVAANKRVLVVSPRRASLQGLVRRFSDIGLPGVGAPTAEPRRAVLRGITRNEKAKRPQLAEVDNALVRLRGVLLEYRRALTPKEPGMGVSVLECLQELSRLALLPDPPTTTARLPRRTLEALATDRAAVARVLSELADLGEFRFGPRDSAWHGADFGSAEQAIEAHRTVSRLANGGLQDLLDLARPVIAESRMRPFGTIQELGQYLSLLAGIRDTLDRFQPVVFDRSLGDLIAATAPRRDGGDMSGGNRRRLKKLAREYLRPGVHVGDLHGFLVEIQQQRQLWQRYARAGVEPQVPTGIADVYRAYQQMQQDLSALDGPLGLHGDEVLTAMPLAELQARLDALAADEEALANLRERSALARELHGIDLADLLDDFAARRIEGPRVAGELELAWWKSALESLLQSERALLGANTSVLDRLEADFRLVDEAHTAGSAQLLAWQLAENWKLGLVDWPEEAAKLKQLLRGDTVDADELHRAAPHLTRFLAPVWLASPYEVPLLPEGMGFDAVVLLDAGSMSLAETVPAIRRSRQVVVVGDPVTQAARPFRIAVGEVPVDAEDFALQAPDVEPEEEVAEAPEEHSAYSALAALLPRRELTRSYRAGGDDLAGLVNRRFYGGRIAALPWAGSFLGHDSIGLELLRDGSGMPDSISGAVESPDAELNRVVALVLEHARQRPNESLMVVTASRKHAARLQREVTTALRARSELVDFLVRDRAEPLLIATLEQAVEQSRDRVIFSIGYGRTPHGRLLSEFGALGGPEGERLLAVAMTRARRGMVVVSAFKPEHVEEHRMGRGVVLLAEILREIQSRGGETPLQDDSDPMLTDLARRLEHRGLRTALGYRGALGLVVGYRDKGLVVESDRALGEGTLREVLRQRPEQLRRLGWSYERVHSFELFADPDAVADRIAQSLGAAGRSDTQPVPALPGT